jgi:hypothetical protein
VGNLQSIHCSFGYEFQARAVFKSKQWAVEEMLEYVKAISRKGFRKAK